MAFTDLTTEFDFKDLLTWQNMEKLAANDAYNNLASGTVMPFYQAAAPTGWVKSTAFVDCFLRVTSGTGAGTGGTVAVSTGLVLPHSHTMSSHTHTLLHDHVLDYSVGVHQNSGVVVASGGSVGAVICIPTATNQARYIHTNMTQTGAGGTSGATAPGTDSQLSNLIFAYADVIMCVKS